MTSHRVVPVIESDTMVLQSERQHGAEQDVEVSSDFADLFRLAETDIEVTLVENLSDDLHRLFDPVTDATLPIYFGPLLGRLYLEGL